MICAEAAVVAPKVVVLTRAAVPIVAGGPAANAAVPISVNCCVGAAFQRTIPPNVLMPKLMRAHVVALEGVGCVAAVTNVVCAVGVAFDCMGPSAFGAASAVGVVAAVENGTKTKFPKADAEAMPETIISSISMIWVEDVPTMPIYELAVAI